MNYASVGVLALILHLIINKEVMKRRKDRSGTRTMTLYGSSGDYGAPRLSFLNRIPSELSGYKFFYSPIWGLPGNELDLSDIEWF